MNEKTICCDKLTDVKFKQIARKTSQTYNFKQQPIRLFNGERSPFIAVEIPKNSRFVQVFSFANGLFIQTATLVYPEIIALDNEKNVITHLKPYEAWENGLPTTLDLEGNLYYNTQFSLPQQTKYLILFTDKKLNNKKTTINWRSQVGGSEYRDITLTSLGKLTLKFL